MKNNFICFLVFAILVSLFANLSVSADSPLSGQVFVLDAGHGGVDPGTVVGEIYEKDINLKITFTLKNELEQLGANVILTRSGDYDLGTPNALYRKKSDFDHRIKMINHSNATYYLSIHLNYLSSSNYSGPQVFYSSVLDENQKIALHLQEYLNSKLNGTREVKKISNTIYMYSKLNVPGVLVECGFLSNANERSKLLDDNYLKEFAKYVAESFESLKI